MTPNVRKRVDSMATFASMDAVRRKIQTLQQVAYEAEERAEMLQAEADMERQARERVTLLLNTRTPRGDG